MTQLPWVTACLPCGTRESATLSGPCSRTFGSRTDSGRAALLGALLEALLPERS